MKTYMFKDFPGHSRFDTPSYIKRVTGGRGGECYLIIDEKIALYDSGMAYCHDEMIKNIERELEILGRSEIDFALCSHTHYDHIGALPYVIARWPRVKVAAAEKAARVFESLNAKNTMKRLGEAASDLYGNGGEVSTSGLRVDMVLGDGDVIDLGTKKIVSYTQPGHTDCSLGFMIEPDKVFFASESTGVLRTPLLMTTAILKSFDQTIESAKKARTLEPRFIISPHYGIVTEDFSKEYFDLYIRTATAERNFIRNLAKKGYSREKIYQEYEKNNWNEERESEQPKAAFKENAKYIIDVFTRDILG